MRDFKRPQDVGCTEENTQQLNSWMQCFRCQSEKYIYSAACFAVIGTANDLKQHIFNSVRNDRFWPMTTLAV
jgi:hypothetical protein